ncbi:unnamed protein product [Acidithrix sp. C25]|nr:unnamed protein product [Acidithrix sp. C25]
MVGISSVRSLVSSLPSGIEIDGSYCFLERSRAILLKERRWARGFSSF